MAATGTFEGMTFNENARVGGNRAKRRGAGVAVAGGGIAGLGAIAILLLSLFTGGDFTDILGGVPQSGTATESEIENCETGADANERDDCRLAAASLAVDQFWTSALDGYRRPQLIIVDQQTSTACGTASNATGPFYCPPEETVYIDPTFFGLLRQQFGATAGPLAQLYVLAHEYGHHVQNITGIMDRYPNNGTGPDSNGVRIELQADCFAGAWVGEMTEQVDENGVPFLVAPTEAEIRDALDAAGTVGDDHIQESATGHISPETWTHGSSEQRQRWFLEGYQHGVAACDTFSVQGGSL